MRRRAAVANGFVLLAALTAQARAEENRFNVHLELGPLLTLQQPTPPSSDRRLAVAGLHARLTLEYEPHERVGIEIFYGPDVVFAQISGNSEGQQYLGGGVKVRPWYNRQGGYLLPRPPKRPFVWRDFLSDVWLDAHAAAVFSDRTRAAYDVGAGARLPLYSPLQIGIFVRFMQQFAVSGAADHPGFLQLSSGVTLSVGVLPVHGEPDADDDGVPDAKDKCPDTPKGKAVNSAGCPITLHETANQPRCSDSDLDGVCDGDDDCPDTPAGAKVDEHGCPAASE
jgi:hypothetical protein